MCEFDLIFSRHIQAFTAIAQTCELLSATNMFSCPLATCSFAVSLAEELLLSKSMTFTISTLVQVYILSFLIFLHFQFNRAPPLIYLPHALLSAPEPSSEYVGSHEYPHRLGPTTLAQ